MNKRDLYTGNQDAEYILENIMGRTRWTFAARDKIAAKLREIVVRERKSSRRVGDE